MLSRLLAQLATRAAVTTIGLAINAISAYVAARARWNETWDETMRRHKREDAEWFAQQMLERDRVR